MVNTFLLMSLFFFQLIYALFLLSQLRTTYTCCSIFDHACHLHHRFHLGIAVLLLHLEHLLHHGFFLFGCLSQGLCLFLAIVSVSHGYLCISSEMRKLRGTNLFGRHIGKLVVSVYLLIALDGGNIFFVLVFLLVQLGLHLSHLLELVHLALMAVSLYLFVVELILALAVVCEFVVFQFLGASQEMVFFVKLTLAHHLLEVIVVFLGFAVEVTVVLLFLNHPFALTLFVLDAPVATAFQVPTFPVMVGARVVERPF